MAQSRVLREVIKAYTYVIIWMSVSISVIMFNKWLLAYSGFPYPIALTMWHMAFCSTVGFLCVHVARFVKPHNMSARDYLRRVMPIGAQPDAVAPRNGSVPEGLLLSTGDIDWCTCSHGLHLHPRRCAVRSQPVAVQLGLPLPLSVVHPDD